MVNDYLTNVYKYNYYKQLLPVEINIDYEWDEHDGLMKIDLDLPEIEDLPESTIVRTGNGLVKRKKKTQTELRTGYAKLVFGLAMYICSNVFNISPMIQKILISGYTQRRDKNGDEIDAYVYSLKFDRQLYENLDIEEYSPIEFCKQADNRMNITQTYILKEIKPFDTY